MKLPVVDPIAKNDMLKYADISKNFATTDGLHAKDALLRANNINSKQNFLVNKGASMERWKLPQDDFLNIVNDSSREVENTINNQASYPQTHMLSSSLESSDIDKMISEDEAFGQPGEHLTGYEHKNSADMQPLKGIDTEVVENTQPRVTEGYEKKNSADMQPLKRVDTEAVENTQPRVTEGEETDNTVMNKQITYGNHKLPSLNPNMVIEPNQLKTVSPGWETSQFIPPSEENEHMLRLKPFEKVAHVVPRKPTTADIFRLSSNPNMVSDFTDSPDTDFNGFNKAVPNHFHSIDEPVGIPYIHNYNYNLNQNQKEIFKPVISTKPITEEHDIKPSEYPQGLERNSGMLVYPDYMETDELDRMIPRVKYYPKMRKVPDYIPIGYPYIPNYHLNNENKGNYLHSGNIAIGLPYVPKNYLKHRRPNQEHISKPHQHMNERLHELTMPIPLVYEYIKPNETEINMTKYLNLDHTMEKKTIEYSNETSSENTTKHNQEIKSLGEALASLSLVGDNTNLTGNGDNTNLTENDNNSNLIGIGNNSNLIGIGNNSNLIGINNNTIAKNHNNNNLTSDNSMILMKHQIDSSDNSVKNALSAHAAVNNTDLNEGRKVSSRPTHIIPKSATNGVIIGKNNSDSLTHLSYIQPYKPSDSHRPYVQIKTVTESNVNPHMTEILNELSKPIELPDLPKSSHKNNNNSDVQKNMTEYLNLDHTIERNGEEGNNISGVNNVLRNFGVDSNTVIDDVDDQSDKEENQYIEEYMNNLYEKAKAADIENEQQKTENILNQKNMNNSKSTDIVTKKTINAADVSSNATVRKSDESNVTKIIPMEQVDNGHEVVLVPAKNNTLQKHEALPMEHEESFDNKTLNIDYHQMEKQLKNTNNDKNRTMVFGDVVDNKKDENINDDPRITNTKNGIDKNVTDGNNDNSNVKIVSTMEVNIVQNKTSNNDHNEMSDNAYQLTEEKDTNDNREKIEQKTGNHDTKQVEGKTPNEAHILITDEDTSDNHQLGNNMNAIDSNKVMKYVDSYVNQSAFGNNTTNNNYQGVDHKFSNGSHSQVGNKTLGDNGDQIGNTTAVDDLKQLETIINDHYHSENISISDKIENGMDMQTNETNALNFNKTDASNTEEHRESIVNHLSQLVALVLQEQEKNETGAKVMVGDILDTISAIENNKEDLSSANQQLERISEDYNNISNSTSRNDVPDNSSFVDQTTDTIRNTTSLDSKTKLSKINNYQLTSDRNKSRKIIVPNERGKHNNPIISSALKENKIPNESMNKEDQRKEAAISYVSHYVTSPPPKNNNFAKLADSNKLNTIVEENDDIEKTFGEIGHIRDHKGDNNLVPTDAEPPSNLNILIDIDGKTKRLGSTFDFDGNSTE